MQTVVLKADGSAEGHAAILKAAEIIKNGGIVAMPTETVYGLACSIFDENAANEVFSVKGRPLDNPLIVHISDFNEIYDICENVPKTAKILADKFWPGPLTMILKKKKIVPDFISAGLDTVAVRCPSHPAAREFIKACGVPLAAPSANTSGKPSTTTAQHVLNDHNGKIPLILDGGTCDVGVESTIIDLTVLPPAILRFGGVSTEDIEKVIGKVNSEKKRVADNETPKAPGMKYRHYAPKAPLIAVCGSPAVTAKYIAENSDKNDGIICFKRYMEFMKCSKMINAGERYPSEFFANILFSAFRQLDEDGVNRIFVQCPARRGIGAAVFNRTEKASGGNVIRLHKTVIVGVTGSSGCGKSAVCENLAKMGAVHIDCDKVYKELLKTCVPMRNEIFNAFPECKTAENTVDTKTLGGIVFSNIGLLEKLNAITHPYVIRRVCELLDEEELKNTQMIALDAPTLFESGLDRYCDVLVGVKSDKKAALKRIAERDGISEEYAEKRLRAMKSDEFYAEKCDYVIENYGDLKKLAENCGKLYNKILSDSEEI